MACRSIPADPEGTSKRVEGGTLRVGLIDAPPWAEPIGAAGEAGTGEPHGVEVDLTRAFAAELHAEVRWTTGRAADLFHALEQHELDLVIGGLGKKDPGVAKLGATRPYLTERTCVGVLPGEHVDHLGTITVRLGDPAAAKLDDAKLVRVPNPGRENAPVLAPDWQLEGWGLSATRDCPREVEHVLVGPPGENAFVMRLERFLEAHGEGVRRALVDSARRS